ncbi:hypothetical protein, partial [Ruminococcus sp.]|uniref:hypothetical protein n=1 Tax=Ruminococcus sp. TaxID=41978 RepID=UPI003FEFC380
QKNLLENPHIFPMNTSSQNLLALKNLLQENPKRTCSGFSIILFRRAAGKSNSFVTVLRKR